MVQKKKKIIKNTIIDETLNTEESTSDKNKITNQLVVGFDSGTLLLYEMPTFQNIHTQNISKNRISTININNTGEQLAIGSSELGQLVVWEWKSEIYILKQQSHNYDTNIAVFSPDGQILATGSDDSKIKLWDTNTNFCFVTFTHHIGPVIGLEFIKSKNVLISAGYDGTVRAYDLLRYRNFRILKPPIQVQLTCLACDSSGEIIIASSFDPYEIYIWSLQTGKLIDILVGHKGPISCISYSEKLAYIASSSWDHTVRIWDIYNGKGQIDIYEHPTDVISVIYRQDGLELCTSCINGCIYVWDTNNGQLKSIIDGKNDLKLGRTIFDKRTSERINNTTAYFTSICYSIDGKCILAGGNSNYICIYDISSKLLIARYTITNNLSYQGIKQKLSTKNIDKITGINLYDINDDNSQSDNDNDNNIKKDKKKNILPGAKRIVDNSIRDVLPTIRIKHVHFSPTGLQWSICTNDGVIIYALDDTLQFNPIELDLDTTPQNCLQYLHKLNEYNKSLIISLRINDRKLIEYVLFNIPINHIILVVRSLPMYSIQRLLEIIAIIIDTSKHIEFLLRWLLCIIMIHGKYIKKSGPLCISSCRALLRVLLNIHKDLSYVCDTNQYLLQYFKTFKQHITREELDNNINNRAERIKYDQDIFLNKLHKIHDIDHNIIQSDRVSYIDNIDSSQDEDIDEILNNENMLISTDKEERNSIENTELTLQMGHSSDSDSETSEKIQISFKKKKQLKSNKKKLSLSKKQKISHSKRSNPILI